MHTSLSLYNYDMVNLKNNADITTCFIDSNTFGTSGEDGVGWIDDEDSFAGNFKLPTPITLDGDNSDKIIVRVRDNLNAIQRLKVSIRSWRAI